jgi:hypothetical protein
MINNKIVSVTLEFTIQTDASDSDLDIILETMMRSAADAVSNRLVTGTGFTYSYTRKKSKRGMTITTRKKP